MTTNAATLPTIEPMRDLERMRRDIAATATLAQTPYNNELTASILTAYRDYFEGSPVSFRTSTKPIGKRELNVRYVELGRPHDPYKIARDKGFLSPIGHPVDTVLDAIQGKFPILGYGVDIGVAFGLEKIWPFFPHRPQPLAEVCALPFLPQSIRNYQDYFHEFDFDVISLFAVDFRFRTINLYFMKPPDTYSADRIGQMFARLGFNVPNPELLHYCAKAVPIYFTFDWESPQVQRLCFAVAVPDASMVPTHLDPLIQKFVTGAPFLSPTRMYLFNITAGRTGDFIKIENDYTGTMVMLMRRFAEASPR